MIPFVFVVEGIPISLQGKPKSKEAWKQKVRNEATKLWPALEAPFTRSVQVTITYFYEKEPLDVDNMLKPILDALNNLVYLDDRQITDVIGRKRDLTSNFTLQNISPLLARTLARGKEFVYIEVELAQLERLL